MEEDAGRGIRAMAEKGIDQVGEESGRMSRSGEEKKRSRQEEEEKRHKSENKKKKKIQPTNSK